MVKKANQLKETYNAPTPKKWRRIGDAILTIGTTITTVSALFGSHPYVIASAAIITAIGKIITNFTK